MYGNNNKKSKAGAGAILLALLVLTLLGVGAFLLSNGSGSSQLSSSAIESDADTEDNTGTVSDVDNTESLENLSMKNGLKMKLKDYQFRVVGTVPDEATLARVTETTGLVYGSYGKVDVSLDPSQPSAPWNQSVGLAIQTLGNFTYGGEITLTNDAVSIDASSPGTQYQALISRQLSQQFGYPELTANIEVREAEASEILMVSEKGHMTATGVMNSEQLRQEITAVLTKVWGDDSDINISVDESRYALMGWKRFDVSVGGLGVYKDFEAGSVKGVPYIELKDGVNFAPGEVVLSPTDQQKLAAIVPIMLATNNTITVEGHTDHVGSEAANLALSKARAESVAAAMRKMSGDRLKADRFEIVALGESQPLAPGQTEADKAKNRRVVVTTNKFDS